MNNHNFRQVRLCMGSSCYCRGNDRNAPIIQDHLKANGLEGSVELSGTLCEGNCLHGPVLNVDGKVFLEVQPSAVADLLNHVLGE